MPLRPKLPVRLLQVASVAVPLVALVVWGQRSWQSDLEHASALAVRDTDVVREYVLRAIQTADGAIAQAELAARGLSWDEIATPAIHEELKRIDDRADIPNGIAFIDPTGRVRNSSIAFPVSSSVADRDYFMALRDGDDALFIGQQIHTRISDLDVIPVARRRSEAAFGGLIIANLDVSALTRFFEKARAHDQTVVGLVRRDGYLLARAPAIPPVKFGPDTPVMRALATGSRGTYRGVASIDQVERIYAFAQVGELPVFISYGFSVQSVAAGWRTNMYIAGAFAILCSVLLLAAASRARTVQRHRDKLVAEVEAQTAELKAALAEKNVLLREVHHRVKNNLAMTVGLVRVISRKASPDAQPYFREIAQRLTAVGKIYSQVHQSGDLSTIDVAVYLREVCAEITRAFGSDTFKLRTRLEPIIVDADTALPLGLIVSELVANAFKHAFKNRNDGEVLVRVSELGDRGILTVRDNGCGLPATVRPNASGLGLVEALAKQIGGTYRAKTRPEGGAQFRITFNTGAKRRNAEARVA